MNKLEPTYRDALVKSWKFVMHHHVLWMLGVVAVIIDQFGFGNFFNYILNYLQTGSVGEVKGFVPYLWNSIYGLQGMELLTFSWLLLIMLSLFALLIVISVCAQGALIAAACGWFKLKSPLKLQKIWHKGVKHFWRLLTVEVLHKLFITLIIVALSLILKNTALTVVQVVSIVVSSLLALLLSVIKIYVAGYVVEREYTLKMAFFEGWNLFRNHLVVSLETSILLALLNVVLVVVIIALSALALLPAILVWLVAAALGSKLIMIIGGIVAVFSLTLVIVLVGGLFNAYTVSCWMYLFMKMSRRTLRSRVYYFLGRLLKKI
jgi:hypothetical protein